MIIDLARRATQAQQPVVDPEADSGIGPVGVAGEASSPVILGPASEASSVAGPSPSGAAEASSAASAGATMEVDSETAQAKEIREATERIYGVDAPTQLHNRWSTNLVTKSSWRK